MPITDDELRQEKVRQQGTWDLVKQLSRQVSMLVRQEVELAKAEMTEKGKKAGLGAGMLAGAVVAGMLTLGTLTASLVLVLDLVLPVWAAALIVTIMWGIVTGGLALGGRRKLEEVGKPVPEKAVESVKEDVEWVKDRIKSGMKSKRRASRWARQSRR